MNLWLGNPGLLLGMLGLGIPLLIHLLHRRRHEVVDWGAMQFLEVAPRQRRRWWWEEFLLLAVRLGLVAILVLALATPQGAGPLLRPLAKENGREIVVVVDGSSSMRRVLPDGSTPWSQAWKRIETMLADSRPGDRFGIVLAGAKPRSLGGDRLAAAVELQGNAPEAAFAVGFPDWPRAVERAAGLFSEGEKENRYLVLVHDGQQSGWGDGATLEKWERLSPEATKRAVVRYEQVGGSIPGENFWLTPLRGGAPLAWPGQKMRFAAEIGWCGRRPEDRPRKLQVRVNGKDQESLPIPEDFAGERGRRRVEFWTTFQEAGSRSVSLVLDCDPPPGERTEGRRLRDSLAEDDQRHVVVEVVQDLPVLLVDGAGSQEMGGTTLFLHRALAPAAKGTGATAPTVWPAARLRPEDLWEAEGDRVPARLRWRTIVLADVPAPSTAVSEVLEQHVRAGGGLLVFLGPQAARERADWNARTYRGGKGWLPAEIEGVVGKEEEAGKSASPDPASIDHPALERFADPSAHALQRVRFPKHVQVRPAPEGTVLARMVGGVPFLVERSLGKGRVILCSVPPDRSWNSDFPVQGDYPVLVHELLRYLGGFAATPASLAPEDTYRWGPSIGRESRTALLPARGMLRLPDGTERSVFADKWPWETTGTRIPGPYELRWDQGGQARFVVEVDPKESDLTPCSVEEAERVARLLGMQAEVGKEDPLSGQEVPVDLWWVFFLGMVGLLCLEIHLTRRVTAGRGGLADER